MSEWYLVLLCSIDDNIKIFSAWNCIKIVFMSSCSKQRTQSACSLYNAYKNAVHPDLSVCMILLTGSNSFTTSVLPTIQADISGVIPSASSSIANVESSDNNMFTSAVIPSSAA